MSEKLYSRLGHTHRCEICERLYTCTENHGHGGRPATYRCKDCPPAPVYPPEKGRRRKKS